MKVPLHIVQARREQLAQLLREHRYLPLSELCARLGVSEATARRDLAALATERKITRTYGGALGDFNERFPSFHERRAIESASKEKLARAALRLFKPGGTYYLDSGTTVFALADAFREQPVTPVRLVTCNLPVGELLSELPGVEVFQIAGQLLKRQAVLSGETARKSLGLWKFDIAFLSAEGMNAEGMWNSEASIVEQQKAAARRAECSAFLLTRSKLGAEAPCFLLPWTSVDLLISDATAKELKAAGVTPRSYLQARS